MTYKEQALKRLSEVVTTIKVNELVEVEAVAQARAQGCSWSEIADLYDVTRQAAHSRWAQKERDGWS